MTDQNQNIKQSPPYGNRRPQQIRNKNKRLNELVRIGKIKILRIPKIEFYIKTKQTARKRLETVNKRLWELKTNGDKTVKEKKHSKQ